jgi:hypothetical protein
MEDRRKNAEFTCHCVNEGTKGTVGGIFIRIRPRCDRVARPLPPARFRGGGGRQQAEMVHRKCRLPLLFSGAYLGTVC